MRPIDADALFDFLADQLEKGTGAYRKGYNAGLNIARSALHNKTITPTITPPPNLPLTLEELREMDEDPVWYQLKDGQKGYGLVSIEKPEQTVFIAGLNGFLIAVYIHGDYNHRLGAKLYRRKPEEGAQ